MYSFENKTITGRNSSLLLIGEASVVILVELFKQYKLYSKYIFRDCFELK